MFSVSTVLGGLGRGAVLRSSCQASWPSPTTTLDNSTKASCLVSCFCFCFVVVVFLSVRGCMGIDVRVNVFRMSFLRADSGPWRKMSRA